MAVENPAITADPERDKIPEGRLMRQMPVGVERHMTMGAVEATMTERKLPTDAVTVGDFVVNNQITLI